jgi:hypothetical protein
MPAHKAPSANIILCTLNAKYIHASLGLRYLMANMARHGDENLTDQTTLIEFTLARPLSEMLEQLLKTLGDDSEGQVQVIGFGVYIWNVLQTTELVRMLKAVRPQLKIILGGPEVSHETDQQEIVQLVEQEASCELFGLLKRPDEKYVTERAYDNPKFVEDMVRDVAARLNAEGRIDAYVVESENFESIHNHSAYALIEKD